jgi:hypothetical protein
MTWNQQIRGLKRKLSKKQQTLRAIERKRARARDPKLSQSSPVVVCGEVSQTFLDRMRTKGVRVEIRS